MPALDPMTLLLLRTANEMTPSPDTGGVPIICAWPVSGQYGFGTRVLYYLLVAACVIAQRLEWLRNACLAAALLFPVTAAIHGIVLAAVHTDDAVDMDIYGALQLCAIGVLVAPVSVRLSSTYNKSEGRNLIFAWSAVLLAGLISLVVEFYRSNPQMPHCHYDGQGNPMTRPSQFPYDNTSFTCNLTCTVGNPVSPIRAGSSNNIYAVPAPTVLTFNGAILIAAGACIPAVLLPASILRQNYKDKDIRFDMPPREILQTSSRESSQPGESPSAEHIEEVFSAETLSEAEAEARAADARDKKWRKAFQRWPLGIIFVVVVLAVLGVGEKNLWSKQVYYQTDYMPNVGQWAPLVGTGLAILGSGYVLLAQAMDIERKKMHKDSGGDEPVDNEPDDSDPTQNHSRQRQHGRPFEKQSESTATVSADDTQIHDNPESSLLHFVARQLVRINDKVSSLSSKSVQSIKGGLANARQRYPTTPGEEIRNPRITRIDTISSSRRLSNESYMSNTSTYTRPRSNTAGSVAARPGREGSSGSMQPGKQKRRDTLEVPGSELRYSTSLPTPPDEVHLPTSGGTNNPVFVITPHEDT